MKFEVKNGCFCYKAGQRQVLQDISFSAEGGDILAVLGPNGAGKTTLLRCALGLLPWNSGGSMLDGVPIAALSAKRLWQTIAYVPQARNTASSCTAEEMVLLGRSSHIAAFAAPTCEDAAIANDAMEQLGIGFLRRKKCSEMSGGELQMVLIARAIAARPRVLVLDEPESNLDFKNQLLVLDTMSRLAQSGMTTIFNTHYPAHALQRASKALMLGADGRYQFGTVTEVVTEKNIRDFFGVHAVIGEIETDGNCYPDILPLGTADRTAPYPTEEMRVVATVSLILPDRSRTEEVNQILHDAAPYLIGRMGLPYPDGGVNIIQLAVDAPVSRVKQLNARLHRIPGISVKTTYAKELAHD